ncbi:hypothetical protein G7046_g2965 [Stylonectria norvegica]|nr:hypothetical protein G7046_g2965 [Stylonectria norvegica]
MRFKLLSLAAPVSVCFLLALILLFGQHKFSVIPLAGLRGFGGKIQAEKHVIANGTILSATKITAYVDAIFDPEATEPPRMVCPILNTARYLTLESTASTGSEDGEPAIDYFFAVDLRDCLTLLPRLLGSVVEAIRFLGPQRCALSIVEGNSPDGTSDVLAAIRYELEALGVAYFFQPSRTDPAENDRIQRLAELRNLALEPLVNNANRTSQSTTVVFLNDVAICVEDILELVFQKKSLGADMTCAMDWTYLGPDPTFYDVWVARGMNGDPFFDIPKDGNWDSAWNLFWNAPKALSRFEDNRPFQVFSCWNGAAAFDARPVIREGLRFRAPNTDAGECVQGEPQLFCKDLWFNGHGKIAVLPSINLEYSDEKGAMIKKAKGYTSDWYSNQELEADWIEWVVEPPEKVKCMPTYDNQYWQAWNESLGA